MIEENRKALFEIPLIEIEEYLKEMLNDEEVDNLFIRCLDCGEYTHISKIDIEYEICDECQLYNEDDEEED